MQCSSLYNITEKLLIQYVHAYCMYIVFLRPEKEQGSYQHNTKHVCKTQLTNTPCFELHLADMHRFKRELKRPKQTQGAFLGPVKCSNHLETKVKSCRSQKVGIKKWRRFFDSMQFAHAQCPLVGFICRKELLQQNGPQDQNQFWLIVSKTSSDLLSPVIFF